MADLDELERLRERSAETTEPVAKRGHTIGAGVHLLCDPDEHLMTAYVCARCGVVFAEEESDGK